MRTRSQQARGLQTAALIALVSLASFSQTPMRAEEVLARHVASIGGAEAIAAAANRKIEGTAQVRNVRVPRSTLLGGAFLASSTLKHVTLLAFEGSNAGDYTGERIHFDGRKLDIPYVTAAERSPVGSFIFDYPEISRGGIFGGALFSSWALLNAASKIDKFELQGKEKIEGVETYKIRYVPKGGSSLTIRMYFDVTTFRHLRTEYSRIETAGTIRVDEGRLNENRFKLIEDFGNFGEVNGLTLPRSYKVVFRYETLQRSAEFEWVIKLTRFGFDPRVEPEIFQQGFTNRTP